MIRLRAQQLGQRIETAEVAFRGLGDVHVADPGVVRGRPRTIRIRIDHPGWGLTTTAVIDFVEGWVVANGEWEITKYAYDVRMVPPPARAGFHWHDGSFHFHCVDPSVPGRDHHFQGRQIDLFDAYRDFGALLGSGGPISCDGLTPVRS